jgi:AcrR family transcriptional regulator
MARRRNLTRRRVVEAALGLVDDEGIAALSMRRLGRALGVEGMALYTHVRSKSDLLDAVAELLLEELDVDFDRTAPWQARIRRGALAWARLQERHPNAFPLAYRGELRTDRVTLLTDELLDALRVAGFDERGAALAYQTIVVLVDGALLGRSSWTDEDLHAAWRRGLSNVDRQRFPRFAEVAPQAATLTWEEVLDSGLDLLLTGLEARLGR